MPLILRVTFSPQRAYCTSSSLMYTLVTVHLWPTGSTTTFWPGFTVPCSTLPIAIVAPMSLYPSSMGMRRALSCCRGGGSMESNVSSSVLPVYHAAVSFRSLMLSPLRPLMGKKISWLSLKPVFFKNSPKSFWIVLYLPSSHSTLGSSILLTAMISFSTPRVLASKACSIVWPPLTKPASNSPLRAEMMSTPMSACDAPLIMLGTYDLWPGASRTVNRRLGVSNTARPTSTVLPFAFSSSLVSMM
mmetsp:Transcript_23717/g.71242  ORF Transcript_23717/g.71242 Transcript_23717/m.71242 type:complete len:245 (+) Transcript_23717:539-1273(+)